VLALFLAAAIAWDAHTGDVRRKVVESQPFESAAVSWIGDAQLRIRTSSDGVAWSDWTSPSRDEDIFERNATAITHFGAAKRFLEYEFDAPVQRVIVTTFPPAPPRLAAAALPGMIRTRADWGCPDGQTSRWTPGYAKVTHAVVHHTAGSNTLQNWEAEVLSIWHFHTFTNGWGDIGYNFLIDPNGVIYEGRAGGDGAIGAHFSCRNTNTVGVALLGTYSNVPPTDAALASLEALLAELLKRNNIAPMVMALHAPSQLLVPTIIGHRDGNPSTLTCSKTECPGNVLYAMLPSIRSAVAAQMPVPPRRRAAGR
jgi:N-acetylmuramoyl-L-alanine amidase